LKDEILLQENGLAVNINHKRSKDQFVFRGRGMEDDIISRAGRCAELAQMLLAADEEARYEESKDMREALLKLYYAEKLEEEMKACQALLAEDTSEETVEAVEEAAGVVRAASDAAFGLIESYSASDAGFAAKIDKLRLDDADDGLFDLLCKLYKCEGIIRMAYRCATWYSACDPYDTLLDDWKGTIPKRPTGVDPESFIARAMDIDIMELLDIRADLIRKIAPIAEEMH